MNLNLMDHPRGIALAVAVIAIRRSRGLACTCENSGHNGWLTAL
jgi:hypothetical protein